MNLLAYVHLRNIHASTGAGRTARQIVEHMAPLPGVQLKILADANDKARILTLVGQPWTGYNYATFAADTSRQQAKWFFTGRPKAESYWSEAELVFCTAESYVPVNKARLAMTAHDASYFEEYGHKRDRRYWQTRLKWQLLFHKLTRKVDLFHTVSQFSADRLTHFFPAIKDRIRCVHNGVTPHFFEPVTAEGKDYLVSAGLSERSFVLIPGGLHYRKNAELILEALPELIRQFPGVQIAIVNHTNPQYAARAAAFAPRVQLLGFVSDEALHALYAAADLVWFPSRYEGFGLPVVEAMACGTPVVASNSSSIPEIAGDAALLADPSDAGAHIRAISSLLTDARARDQLTKAGRKRAVQFTWQRTAQELKQHFEALL